MILLKILAFSLFGGFLAYAFDLTLMQGDNLFVRFIMFILVVLVVKYVIAPGFLDLNKKLKNKNQ